MRKWVLIQRDVDGDYSDANARVFPDEASGLDAYHKIVTNDIEGWFWESTLADSETMLAVISKMPFAKRVQFMVDALGNTDIVEIQCHDQPDKHVYRTTADYSMRPGKPMSFSHGMIGCRIRII